MAKKPRVRVPKSAKRGEAVEIKTMMPHTMETGTRKVKGKVVPRMIVNKFECKYGGATVFSADLHPATAANPPPSGWHGRPGTAAPARSSPTRSSPQTERR